MPQVENTVDLYNSVFNDTRPRRPETPAVYLFVFPAFMTFVNATILVQPFKAEETGSEELLEQDLRRLVIELSGFGLFMVMDIFRIDALSRWLAS